MASLAQLQNDVMGWLNRRDIAALVPGWVTMTEADITQMLRTRAMVTNATQDVDADLVSLPPDFASMAALRNLATGKLLALEDDWTGPLYGDGTRPTTSYRLVGDAIEFLPHPVIPDPPQLGWQPMQVRMTYFRAPVPLKAASDTNAVLEAHYQVYLFGLCKYGAMFELDDARASQMTSAFVQAVTDINIWFENSTYSGAPLRAAPAKAF
jgi:hypothetical protein